MVRGEGYPSKPTRKKEQKPRVQLCAALHSQYLSAIVNTTCIAMHAHAHREIVTVKNKRKTGMYRRKKNPSQKSVTKRGDKGVWGSRDHSVT